MPKGFFEMARILITGGAGFIGSNMADFFLEKGHDIHILDNLSTGNLKNLTHIKSQVSLYEGDICDDKVLQKAIKNCDYVFHLAALRSVPKSFSNPEEYERVNVIGTIKLLQLSVENKIKKFVFASSSSVYGDATKLPLKENLPCNPISPYAISKFNAELYCKLFYNNYKLPTVALRYFNVFGPRQSLENKYAVVIPKFIQALYSNETPPVYGDGHQTRDFTFVENVIAAHEAVIKSDKTHGKAYNVACGERHSVLDLAKDLNKIMKKDIKPRFLTVRPGDVLHTQASIDSLHNDTGYVPPASFHKGLEKTVAWFLDHPDYLVATKD